MLAAESILFGGTIRTVNLSELAKAVDTDPSTMSRWKNNTDNIRFGTLKKMVRVLNLTDRQILNLFGREGKRYD